MRNPEGKWTREKVILFSQPGALPTSGLEEGIARTQALDMQQVHAELAAQKTQAKG